jgi:hypothetical protein
LLRRVMDRVWQDGLIMAKPCLTNLNNDTDNRPLTSTHVANHSSDPYPPALFCTAIYTSPISSDSRSRRRLCLTDSARLSANTYTHAPSPRTLTVSLAVHSRNHAEDMVYGTFGFAFQAQMGDRSADDAHLEKRATKGGER